MKYIIIIALATFSSTFAQITPSYKASISLGPSFQIIPTRINTDKVNGANISESKFAADTQYTVGLLGSLTLIPFKCEYGQYEFTPSMSVHWMGKQSGYTRGFANKIILGKGRLYGVLGYQDMLKIATMNKLTQINFNEGTLYRSYSSYRSHRKSIGLRFLYGDENKNSIELNFISEKFITVPSMTTNGYSFAWNINKTAIQIDYFPKHISKGNRYSTQSIVPPDLAMQGMFMQFSIRAQLSYENNYPNKWGF